MSKTIPVKLSQQLIADFQDSFDKKEDERAYLYHKITEDINKKSGDVFLKRKCTKTVFKNGTQTQEMVTFDELGLDTFDIPTDDKWIPEDISGTIENYSYIVGAKLWDKITNYVKLTFLLNKIRNESTLEYLKSQLTDHTPDKKPTKEDLEKLKEQISGFEKLNKNDCLEIYLHGIFAPHVISKVISNEKTILDKEFEELNKPKEKKTK